MPTCRVQSTMLLQDWAKVTERCKEMYWKPEKDTVLEIRDLLQQEADFSFELHSFLQFSQSCFQLPKPKNCLWKLEMTTHGRVKQLDQLMNCKKKMSTPKGPLGNQE